MARLGSETIVAATTASSWGAAIPSDTVGANTGIIPKEFPMLSVGGDPVFDEGIANLGELQYADLLEETVEGSIAFTMRRSGAEWQLWANLFGDDTVTGSNPYTHTFNWQTSAALLHHMAMEVNNADIVCIPAMVVTGATIAPSGDGRTDITYNFIGDTLDAADDGSLQDTGTEFDAVTYITKALVAPSAECRIRLNAQAGGALGSSDELNVVNYNLQVNRNYSNERGTIGASNGLERQILQPVRAGYSEVMLTLEFADYASISRFQDFSSQTQYKADLYWAKTVGATAYSFLIELGALIPLAPSGSVVGGERVPLTWNFKAVQPQSTPTGMATSNIIHSVLVDAFSTTYE